MIHFSLLLLSSAIAKNTINIGYRIVEYRGADSITIKDRNQPINVSAKNITVECVAKSCGVHRESQYSEAVLSRKSTVTYITKRKFMSLAVVDFS